MALVESALTYSLPPLNLSSNANAETLTQVFPSSGTVFRSDSNAQISLSLSSANAFARTYKSYLKYTVIARDGAGAIVGTGSQITRQGLSSVFSRVVIRLGAAEVESLDNYNTLVNLVYSRSTPEKANALRYFEGADDVNALASGKRTVIHPIQSSFLSNQQAIPLPVISNGGLQIELTLAGVDKVFTSSAGIHHYEISNLSWNVELVTPEPGYVSRLFSGLAKSQSLQIPYVRTRSFLNYGSGGTENDVTLSVGQPTSVQGVAIQFLPEANGIQSVDKAFAATSAGLRSFYIQIGSSKWPQSKDIQYSANPADFDPEAVFVGLLSAYDAYTYGNSVNLNTAAIEQGAFVLTYNFKGSSETWADGYNMQSSDGTIRIHTTHTSPVDRTCAIRTLVFIDSLLSISRDIITVTDRI